MGGRCSWVVEQDGPLATRIINSYDEINQTKRGASTPEHIPQPLKVMRATTEKIYNGLVLNIVVTDLL